jgi:hypothetical protein
LIPCRFQSTVATQHFWTAASGESGFHAYNIISSDLVHLAPRIHDEAIVERNEGNNINALGLELA